MKRLTGCGLLARIASAAVLATPAFAHTYVVDSHGGSGVDFTDLPPAIAAVQPGDVLRVMPGSYSSFTCSQGISILGYGSPVVNGAATFSSIPPGQAAAVTGLRPTSVTVTSCGGRVILQQMSGLPTVSIVASADVRLLEVGQDAGTSSGQIGTHVVGSRVEVVQSTVRGGGILGGDCTTPGAEGLRVETAGRVHFALSGCRGGDGPFGCYSPGMIPVAPGGPGISASDSEVIVAGAGAQPAIVGGNGGWDVQYPNCWNAGSGGAAIHAANAMVSYSGVRVFGGFSCFSGSINDPNCFCGRNSALSGSTVVSVSPEDSTLALSGTPTAGQTLSLTLTGDPGSDVYLWLGRHLVLVNEPGVEIELGVDRQRVAHLGAMPSTGSITVPLHVPGSYVPGVLFAAQGECRLASGAIRRTNSIPIVVR